MIKKLPALFITASFSLLAAGFSAQAPSLGTTAEFALFTTNGAIVNVGVTHITGHVGSNNGSSTGFGNVNGTMHNNNGATAAAAADLLLLYNQLNSAVATQFPAPLMGNGQTLNAGIYSISGNTTLNNTLTLNGQSNPNAVFIIKIQGTFSSAANSRVVLSNGALACNVFWKVEGAVSLASGTSMKGNIVVNNAAISMSSGSSLEGRAMTTAGAIDVNHVLIYTPTGCGSAVLNGPSAPPMGSAACFAIFSSNGPVTNSGQTFATGDIGTNVGLTTGFNALNINGAIHPIPDGVTSAAATDLLTAYTAINGLATDIELLYPAQFGNSLVLTPHTYLMNGAATFIDTLFLDARNVSTARFVIKINGALSTGTYAKVSLINGALPQNVYWKVEGAIDIDDYSELVGTLISNNGAIDLGTGAQIDGKALTTGGAVQTDAVTVTIPVSCSSAPAAPQIITNPASATVCPGDAVSFAVIATGSGLTYKWRKGNTDLSNGGNISGATTRTLVISPTNGSNVAQNYNVVVSNVTSKDTSSNAALAFKDCSVGLSTQQTELISFYPNPFSGQVNIHHLAGDAQVRIYNLLGAETQVLNVTGDRKTYSLDLSRGLYFYRILREGKTVQSGKLVSE